MVRFSFDLEVSEEVKSRADSVFEGIKNEHLQGKSGYYKLPFDESAFAVAAAFCERERAFLDTLKYLVIIGIGGSSLGLKAIDSMLEHLPHRNVLKLLFLEHTDPINIAKTLQDVERDNTLFIVISKSGTTIETSSLLKYVLYKYHLLADSSTKRHLLAITDTDSPLQSFAQSEGIEYFNIAPNVGGRFSVLSMVGILPLMILGFDVSALLQGAAQLIQRFFERKEEHILHKALIYALNAKQTPMNVLFSYSSLFTHFNAWYVQLWGESLGKINAHGQNVGLTPIALIGSIDQHSFLQLIVQGVRDKSITFLSLDPTHSLEPNIPKLEIPFLESTNFVNGEGFATLLDKQRIATMQSIKNEGIMSDCIKVMKLSEESVGILIAYFELLTSCVGNIFEINTYDQPGVEFGKERLRKQIGRAHV